MTTLASRLRSPFRKITKRVLDESRLPSEIQGVPISYNPDDDRFYAHANDEDRTVICTREATLKGWTNLITFCRQYAKDGIKEESR